MKNRFNVLYNPIETWPKIEKKNFTITQIYLRFLLIMAAIPPIAAYIGAVYIGWRVGFEEPVKLTWQSALLISVSAYIAILVGMYVFARLVHWMAQTYKSEATVADAFALVSYSCVPLFLVSIFSAYPLLWLNTMLTLVAAALAIRILFIGTPVMMKIDQDRGFLFTNSILTVGMVMFVGTIAISVIFWANGVGPAFTR
ncbi:MAG: DUF1282 family protein [Kangiellaceae bacterium]|nr:DUF1282 family protein [Kangiellaceae bacterium]